MFRIIGKLRGGTAVNATEFAPALRVNVGFRDKFLSARSRERKFPAAGRR